MKSPNKQVTITKVSEEMYNCIDNPLSVSPPSNPQHHNLINEHRRIELPSLQQQQKGGSPSNHNGTNGYSNERKIHGFEISQNNSDQDDESSSYEESTQQGPSNENLLGTAFCTFMGFASVQTVVAVFAGSEAMLGDSAAMIVDALTYLFNWYAERKKAAYETREWIKANSQKNAFQDAATQKRILERTKRKNVLQLELVPPCLSVGTLVIVTAFVLKDAVKVLILDVHRGIEKQGNPNIHIMMYFSIANLGLDLVNVANFAKAKHLFGFDTSEETHQHDGHQPLASGDDEEIGVNEGKSPRHAPSYDDDDVDGDEDQDHTANLNMCSAYTHVFADTLRSIAVLVAACLSVLVDGITPEEADASAAVVVSGLILLSLIPLINGLRQSYNELRLIRAEEKNDELLFS